MQAAQQLPDCGVAALLDLHSAEHLSWQLLEFYIILQFIPWKTIHNFLYVYNHWQWSRPDTLSRPTGPGAASGLGNLLVALISSADALMPCNEFHFNWHQKKFSDVPSYL